MPCDMTAPQKPDRAVEHAMSLFLSPNTFHRLYDVDHQRQFFLLSISTASDAPTVSAPTNPAILGSIAIGRRVYFKSVVGGIYGYRFGYGRSIRSVGQMRERYPNKWCMQVFRPP